MHFGKLAKRNGEYLLCIRQEMDGAEFLSVRGAYLEAAPESMAFQRLRDSGEVEELATTAKWVISDKGFTLPWSHFDIFLAAIEELSSMTAIDRPIRVDLPGSNQLQVTLKAFKGHPYVDIREFVPGKKVEWRKTRFGVTFPPDAIAEFQSLLEGLCSPA